MTQSREYQMNCFTCQKGTGGVDELTLPISEELINYAQENFLNYEPEQNIYIEYFNFILNNIELAGPKNWEETENAYFTLMAIANNNSNN